MQRVGRWYDDVRGSYAVSHATANVFDIKIEFSPWEFDVRDILFLEQINDTGIQALTRN